VQERARIGNVSLLSSGRRSCRQLPERYSLSLSCRSNCFHEATFTADLALGHEAAHIAARYLLNLVYEFISLPLWFHPPISLYAPYPQTRELCWMKS